MPLPRPRARDAERCSAVRSERMARLDSGDWRSSWRRVVAAAIARPQAQDQPAAVFRSATSIVSVDVVVRDDSGAIVRGLTADDFTILEDGRPQKIQTFSFQEIVDRPVAALRAGQRAGRGRGAAPRRGPARRRRAAAGSRLQRGRRIGVRGRRLLVLLFDVSSMQPEDVQRAVESATTYAQRADDRRRPRRRRHGRLDARRPDRFHGRTRRDPDGAAGAGLHRRHRGPARDGADRRHRGGGRRGRTTATADETGFETFNNDVRLRALKTLADTLAPIEQKKAILYFSAGMGRSGEDNQVELRAAINAAVRGNVAIYPVDARGLQAVVPGGDARRASGRGVGLFSGRGVAQQFPQLSASQGTLTTLAADTGGRAFTDTNDFGDAFTRVQRDLSAYYLIGYTSTNPGEGRPLPAHSGARRPSRRPRSKRAPATTPSATSPTPTAAIARRSSRISSPPPCRPRTCRWSSAPAGSGRPRVASTSRSRWPCRAPRCRCRREATR